MPVKFEIVCLFKNLKFKFCVCLLRAFFVCLFCVPVFCACYVCLFFTKLSVIKQSIFPLTFMI